MEQCYKLAKVDQEKDVGMILKDTKIRNQMFKNRYTFLLPYCYPYMKHNYGPPKKEVWCDKYNYIRNK